VGRLFGYFLDLFLRKQRLLRDGNWLIVEAFLVD